MKKLSGILVLVLFVFAVEAVAMGILIPFEEPDALFQKNNDYPVVLLHGFTGWGRDELGGHLYWGGYDDLEKQINTAGHNCATAVVGPVSSNWDRACELYAQLTGTRTDYGLVHSALYDHERYGRDYAGKGLIDNWGNNNPDRKIHMIVHSMGGTTARLFAYLLAEGNADEMAAEYPLSEPVSPLFDKKTRSEVDVHSIMTLSTPHNGTTLANGVLKLAPFVVELGFRIAGLLGIDPDSVNSFYDFKLDQFGLRRQEGESLTAYFMRVEKELDKFSASSLKDLSSWDLSPEGSRELNSETPSRDDIYYFSYAGASTRSSLLPSVLDNYEHHHLPQLNNFILWMATCPMMGAYTCNDDRYNGFWQASEGDFYGLSLNERVRIDSSWWENDGIVNTNSQNGPWLYPDNYTGKRDVIVDWDGVSVPEKGVWNYGGILENIDHFDMIGLEFVIKDNHDNKEVGHIEDWIVERVAFLQSLPE